MSLNEHTTSKSVHTNPYFEHFLLYIYNIAFEEETVWGRNGWLSVHNQLIFLSLSPRKQKPSVEMTTARTSVFLKWFERQLKTHITYPPLPESLDPLQFAYGPNRSTDHAMSLHTALSTWTRGTHVRRLFIDYSSAFNIIVPSKLITKLGFLDSELRDGQTPGCAIGTNTSSTLTLGNGALQGCVLSPLLTPCSPLTAPIPS